MVYPPYRSIFCPEIVANRGGGVFLFLGAEVKKGVIAK
jgi:hypothetical protein